MTKLFNLMLFIPIISAQLISMAFCDDTTCNRRCAKWNTNSEQCSPCGAIYCITTLIPNNINALATLTFYSDSSCSTIISLQNIPLQNIPLTVNNNCNQLISGGYIIGYAQALNLSMLIGLTVGFSLLAIGATIASICFCKKNNKCCYKKFAIQSPPPPDIPDKTFEKNPGHPPAYANTVMTYNNPVINY